MRTALDLEDGLLRRARLKAAGEGRTLTNVIEDALRALLGRRARRGRRFQPRLPTRRGTRLPTVDVADRDAVSGLGEERAQGDLEELLREIDRHVKRTGRRRQGDSARLIRRMRDAH
jgi:hypothetical protein